MKTLKYILAVLADARVYLCVALIAFRAFTCLSL
jgi:hypothetical protein